MYTQPEEFIISFHDRLTNVRAQLAASSLDYETLLGASDDRLTTKTADQQTLLILLARVLEIEGELKTFCESPSNLADAIRDCNHDKVLRKSLLARVQKLYAGYDDIISPARDSHASSHDEIKTLLKELKHLFLSKRVFVIW